MLTILTLRRLSPPLLGLTLVNGQAQNLVVPDAGALRQQVEQKRDFAPPSTAQPLKAGSAEPARAPTTRTTLVVKAFQFEGHHLLSTEALNASVNGFVGRSLGFEELQTVRDAVVQAYRDAGWLAQVNLPRQDITSGIVTLKVVEATFAGLRFEGEPPQRVSKEVIESIFAQHIKTGEAARLDQIDRALLLSDDLPGVTVAGALEAGQRDGETALLVKSSDEPAYYGDVAIDNTGSRSTGSQRISANLNINSPTGQGDLLSLALMHTQGINYARLAHTFAAGYSGLRVGANVSRVTYRVVDGPVSQSATPIKGQSDSLGLEANYPWLRGRRINVYVNSALDVKSFRNEDVQVQSDYQRQALRLGVSGNLLDSLSTAALAAITPSVLATLSAAQLANLSAAQIDALVNTQVVALTPAQLAALTSAQLSGLSAADIASLSPAQLAALGILPPGGEPASQVVAAVQSSLPVPIPGVTLPSVSTQPPQLLPAGNPPAAPASGAAAADSSSSSGGGYGTGAGGVGPNINTPGITIDVRNNSTNSLPVLIAVGLPKGSATVGDGFSFDLPQAVREIITEGTRVELTTAQGGALPDWLRYDTQSMRFFAAAVLVRAFPIELQIRVGSQRILIVISERTE